MDEMVGWHHRLSGHEFEQALGDGGGQGSLACCRPWDCKESGITEVTQQQQQEGLEQASEEVKPADTSSQNPSLQDSEKIKFKVPSL